MKGKFITFEGCEGSGKSTQLTLLKNYFDKNGNDYIFTREPGGTPISEKIRNIILDNGNKEMCAECEALLYASSRVQLLKEIVIPALTAGKIVLCDRYIDSSLSYQAYARGLGYDFVAKINDFAFKNCMPDITVFFDIDPCDAFLRKGGADKNDRLEQSGIEFHKKVYEGYKELAKKFPERIVSIGAAKGKEEIHREVLNILRDKGII